MDDIPGTELVLKSSCLNAVLLQVLECSLCVVTAVML